MVVKARVSIAHAMVTNPPAVRVTLVIIRYHAFRPASCVAIRGDGVERASNVRSGNATSSNGDTVYQDCQASRSGGEGETAPNGLVLFGGRAARDSCMLRADRSHDVY